MPVCARAGESRHGPLRLGPLFGLRVGGSVRLRLHPDPSERHGLPGPCGCAASAVHGRLCGPRSLHVEAGQGRPHGAGPPRPLRRRVHERGRDGRADRDAARRRPPLRLCPRPPREAARRSPVGERAQHEKRGCLVHEPPGRRPCDAGGRAAHACLAAAQRLLEDRLRPAVDEGDAAPEGGRPREGRALGAGVRAGRTACREGRDILGGRGGGGEELRRRGRGAELRRNCPRRAGEVVRASRALRGPGRIRRAAHRILHRPLPPLPPAERPCGRRRALSRRRRAGRHRVVRRLLHRPLALGHLPRRAPALHARRAGARGRLRRFDARPLPGDGLPARHPLLRLGVALHDRQPRGPRDRRRLPQGLPRLRRRSRVRGRDELPHGRARRSVRTPEDQGGLGALRPLRLLPVRQDQGRKREPHA